MSVSIDPITLAKVDQFRRRRRMILALRGISAAIVSLLLGMMVVGIVDWLWIISETARWLLSLSAYAVAIASVYWFCWRRLRQDHDPRQMAARLESASPQLHETVLPAIELGQPSDRRGGGSEEFRRLLQRQVAAVLQGVDIRSLLPLGLIRQWILAALGLVLLCAALWYMPGSRFRLLLTRAMLPMANIDRVSRTQVAILEPQPASLTVPENETVGIVVAISGARTENVMLQVFPDDGEERKIPMRRLPDADTREPSPERFAANANVQSTGLTYRILAGDAVTRTYRIDTAPRPVVQQIEKEYQFPDYSGLEPVTVRHEHGDLEALAGSTAIVRFQANQAVREAEVVYDTPPGTPPRRVPLECVDSTEHIYQTALPIQHAAIYQVHLVSAATGFDNPYSPKYEIRPLPDRLPRIGFVDPPDGTLLLPPNELLELRVEAEDELPLVTAAVEVSVNRGQWTAKPLEIPATTHWDLPVALDLLDWDLNAGDQVNVRALAVDRKGQRGQSAPLQILVTSPDFDPQRHRLTDAKLALLVPVQTWAASVDGLRERLLGPVQQRRKDRTPGWPVGFLDDVLGDLQTIDQASTDLIATLTAQLPDFTGGIDAAALELLARAVDRSRYGLQMTMLQLRQIDQEEAEPDDEPTKNLEAVEREVAAAADLATKAAAGFHALVSYDINASVMLDLDSLAKHLDRLRSSQWKPSWERLTRQHTLTNQHISALVELIRYWRPHVSSGSVGPLTSLSDWLEPWSDRLQERMKESNQLNELQRQTDVLCNDLEGRLRSSVLDGGLSGRINEQYYEVDRRIGSIAESIDTATQRLTQSQQQQSAARKQSYSQAIRQANQSWLREIESFADRQPAIVERFETWRSLHQRRRDGIGQFPADLSLAMRAFQSVAETPADRLQLQDLNSVARAYQVLEAGHQVLQFQSDMQRLAEAERWQVTKFEARTRHPLAKDWLEKSAELALQRMRAAGLPESVRKPLEQMRQSPAAESLRSRMDQRRWQSEHRVSCDSLLRTQLSVLQQAIAPLDVELEAAREVLRGFILSTAELAAQTARRLEDLRQQTRQVAEQTAESAQQETAPPTEQTEALRQQQEKLQQELGQVLNELVDMANAQDLLSESGRQLARDIDEALALITPPAQQMQQQMQQAVDASDAIQAATALEATADSQQRTAERLQQVAEHLANVEAGDQTEASRQQLRQAAADLDATRGLEQQYEQAERMADAAKREPQKLLQQLEAELQRNPEMQQALSQIAADVVAQAQQTLQEAARDEQDLQRQLERDDTAFRGQKAILAEQLRQLSEQMAEVDRNLAVAAENAAGKAKDASGQETLRQARESLQAARQMTQPVQPDSLLKDLATAAHQAAEQLEQTSQQWQQAVQATQAAADESIHENDDQRRRQRDAMQRELSQVKSARRHDAGRVLKQAEQRQRDANRGVDRAERAVRDAEKRVEKATHDLEKNPEQSWAQDNLANASQQLQQEQQRKDVAQQFAAAMTQQLESANQQWEQRDAWQPGELNQPNPAAQLAAQLAQEAQRTLGSLQEMARNIADDAGFQDELQAKLPQWQEAARRQARIEQEAQRSADDLQRAARHEQRLNQEIAADVLTQQADAVQQVVDQQLEQAMQSIAQAEQQASDAVQAAREQEQQDGNAAAATPAVAATAAQAQMGQAEKALQDRADALQAALATDAATKADAATADSAQSSVAASGQAESQGPGDAETQQSSPTPASGSQPPDGDQAQQASAANAPAAGTQAGESPSPPATQASATAASSNRPPGQPSRAEQLARTLDELDRALHRPAEAFGEGDDFSATAGRSPSDPQQDTAQGAQQNAAGEGQAAIPSNSNAEPLSPTMAQAAQSRAQAMGMARSEASQQTLQPADAESSTASQSNGQASGGAEPSAPPMVELQGTTNHDGRDWGRLTQQTPEDITEGRRDPVAERYQKQVEAYFRAIAEQTK